MTDKLETARVFVTFYKGSVHIAKKLLESAAATGNDTKKFIFVGTDGSVMDGFRNLTLDVPQGNPVSANRAFMEVAKMCFKNKDDFIFLDSDVTFLNGQAIERISWELGRKQCAILAQPVWVTNDKFTGWCFNGNAAYKWDCYDKLNLDVAPIPDDYPFDFYLSEKYFQKYSAPTGLFLQTGDKTNIRNLDWVDPQCVIHHGCSDGSVADCIVKRSKSNARA